MGAGKQSIIEGGQKGKDNEAEVSGQALHVKAIGTVSVSGTVSVTEPVSVDDSGGSLTVDDVPVRSSVTNLFNAQVFNNVTTSANSSSFDVTLYRYLFLYYTLTVANAPSNIRLIAQFSVDGGTTWVDYSVDQMVDLRFVPGQMPLNECVPLNYVVGKLFRLRAVASGTTASATFTLSAWVEGIN